MTTEPTTTSTDYDEDALASDVRRMLSASGGDAAQVLNSLLTDYPPEPALREAMSILAKVNVAARNAGVDLESMLVEKPRRASDRLADRLRSRPATATRPERRSDHRPDGRCRQIVRPHHAGAVPGAGRGRPARTAGRSRERLRARS
ncbi:MAG: hypothetical protein ABW156_08415 [Jiangellaceae bacterium]